jgi:hypothetical protein
MTFTPAPLTSSFQGPRHADAREQRGPAVAAGGEAERALQAGQGQGKEDRVARAQARQGRGVRGLRAPIPGPVQVAGRLLARALPPAPETCSSHSDHVGWFTIRLLHGTAFL